MNLDKCISWRCCLLRARTWTLVWIVISHYLLKVEHLNRPRGPKWNLTRKRSNFSSRNFISAAAFFLMSDNFFLASASSFARCFSVILKFSINDNVSMETCSIKNLRCQGFSMIFILFELAFCLLEFSFQFLKENETRSIPSSEPWLRAVHKTYAFVKFKLSLVIS